jgi:HPt (histidine-containing phosphotransfer) domain-containing protein
MDDYIAKPVRPDDVRLVLERVAARASASEMAGAGDAAEPAEATNGADAEAEQTPLPPPVDMDRLLDFANGNPENLRELAELYIQQTSGQIEQLLAAVNSEAGGDVRRLAHSCAGASSTCGMMVIGPLLRELERQGLEGLEADASELAGKIEREFDRIREFLEDYMRTQLPPPPLAKAKV